MVASSQGGIPSECLAATTRSKTLSSPDVRSTGRKIASLLEGQRMPRSGAPPSTKRPKRTFVHARAHAKGDVEPIAPQSHVVGAQKAAIATERRGGLSRDLRLFQARLSGHFATSEACIAVNGQDWLALEAVSKRFARVDGPGEVWIPDGCRSQSGRPHVDPGHPSAA